MVILDSTSTYSSLLFRDSRIQRPWILVTVDSLLTDLEARPYIIKINQVLKEKSSISCNSLPLYIVTSRFLIILGKYPLYEENNN